MHIRKMKELLKVGSANLERAVKINWESRCRFHRHADLINGIEINSRDRRINVNV